LEWSVKQITSVFAFPRSVPTRRNRQVNAAAKDLDDVVIGMIEGRRKSGARLNDLLDMLMYAQDEETGESMSNQQLRDEVMTLFLAGHETTANALTWTLMLLSQHPDVARRLRREVTEVLGDRAPTLADLPRLGYAHQVVAESMRLYPPVWTISRSVISDDEIGGYFIPKGSIVLVSPYLTHRSPLAWENPEGFDPDRFSPEREEKLHRFAYFPFGGGPRQCIGNNFALLEAQICLVMIAQCFQAELVPFAIVEPEALITLRPKGGMPMLLRSASA
jgi:cytochrome P450